jgi:hypothetical protein
VARIKGTCIKATVSAALNSLARVHQALSKTQRGFFAALRLCRRSVRAAGAAQWSTDEVASGIDFQMRHTKGVESSSKHGGDRRAVAHYRQADVSFDAEPLQFVDDA